MFPHVEILAENADGGFALLSATALYAEQLRVTVRGGNVIVVTRLIILYILVFSLNLRINFWHLFLVLDPLKLAFKLVFLLYVVLRVYFLVPIARVGFVAFVSIGLRRFRIDKVGLLQSGLGIPLACNLFLFWFRPSH